ncbi:hypothetical protein EMIHUDRAFT_230399 [Emiliania huxleyi CCMP1516]|uniref:Uncharacterized protein n=2 Tax=Emiliania huxleyi TaxID=2903 RepID=A0A0D3KAL4_EMIH1|nr:hypothetical protein EMIHUDRAFT_230399 [Emiliania huxleyi CCMP1516]EOD32799.1 hypothetical protein EMIHUDRAFT_230399 [Emiliania huxleyi CCMP1516]|eukprot:XP_005785228.1 hypothetical protein EMIHUDRAFT_230399 [Emiliania huxleyi CCMP1516]
MLLAALPALAACSALRPSFRQPSAPTRRHAMIFASEGDKLETERAAVEANASQFSESTWSEAVASVEAALAAGWEAQAEERAELRAAIEARAEE